jgi:hypothetical protein
VEVNATFPGAFHHLSLAIVVFFFSISPLSSLATYIHNIIHIHRPFSQGLFTSHIHIFRFATVLGQYSYFYKLGEAWCYNSLPLKGTSSSMFLSINMTCMYRSKQNWICLSHGILHFPCSLIWAKMSPLHLDLCNGSVSERGFFFVQYVGAHRCQVNSFHTSSKGIGHPIFLSFNVFDFKIKLAKEGHPPSLSSIELWLIK